MRVRSSGSPSDFRQRPISDPAWRSSIPLWARMARPLSKTALQKSMALGFSTGAAGPEASASGKSVSVSVSGALPCVTSRFTSSALRFRNSRTRFVLSSSRLGCRRSHPDKRASTMTRPCMASTMAATSASSMSRAAAASSWRQPATLPRSATREASTIIIVKVARTAVSGCPLLRAMTRHFGSVGMSCHRRTQSVTGGSLS